MSKSLMRRFGAFMAVVLLLSAVIVPAAGAAPQANTAESASQSGYSCPVYHRVVRGDNLTKIAYRYGVSISQLMQWNNIWNPDRIYIGQVLVIQRWCQPKPPAPKPPKPPKPPLPGPCSGSECQPQPQSGWRATYYNSPDLTGPIVLDRLERTPCWNCGFNAPAPGVAADRFSIRWTTTSNAVGGTYRISVKTDDGARVYIDGVLVLNEWREQAVRGFFVDVVIPAGPHTWTIEYFEQTGLAEFCYSIQKL